MSHVSPRKPGWQRCEFAMMHDCVSDNDYCPEGIKDPDDCEKYHQKMVAEGEETKEEYLTWKRLACIPQTDGGKTSEVK